MLPSFSGYPFAKALVLDSTKSLIPTTFLPGSQKAGGIMQLLLAGAARGPHCPPQAEHRDVNSFEMFIMFYDFNSFPASVSLAGYLLE